MKTIGVFRIEKTVILSLRFERFYSWKGWAMYRLRLPFCDISFQVLNK